MPIASWFVFVSQCTARVASGVQTQSVGAVGPQRVAALDLAYTALGTLIGVHSLPGVAIAVPAAGFGMAAFFTFFDTAMAGWVRDLAGAPSAPFHLAAAIFAVCALARAVHARRRPAALRPRNARRRRLKRRLRRCIEQTVTSAPTQPPAHACTPEEARAFGARIMAILTGLNLVAAARFRILGPWTVPLGRHFQRVSRRIHDLMARLAAGRYRPQRPQPGRPRPGRPSGPRGKRLPGTHGWLLEHLGQARHEGAVYTRQLETLLHTPEAAALLAAAPSAARTLRPICRLLGVTLPPALAPAPKPPEPPPKPPPAAAPSQAPPAQPAWRARRAEHRRPGWTVFAQPKPRLKPA